MDYSLKLRKKEISMRLKFLAKIWPAVLCSLMLMGTVPRNTYADDIDPGCPSTCTNPSVPSVPEPDLGLVGYAIGFLGVGIAAARSKLRR